MSLYDFFNKEDINEVDNYEGSEIIHNYKKLRFRTEISSFLEFHTPIGMYDNKIISITNKNLSYLNQKMHHYIGDIYINDLLNTCNKLKDDINNDIIIEEPVFYFFDYESINGTGHSYDLMFYLLYKYYKNNLNMKLLIVKSKNVYYNRIIKLLKNNFKVEFLEIEIDKNYIFRDFNCIRTYQNVFFNEVKEFINNKLIIPIIEKYDKLNEIYYKNIYKIKFMNEVTLNNSGILKTEKFINKCKETLIYDLNDCNSDELLIYLINKAEHITVSWGSNYYININYYLENTYNKYIRVLYHPYYNGERWALNMINSHIIRQNMIPYCGEYIDQVYNNFEFNGELFYNVLNIDDIIENPIPTKNEFL